MVAGRTAPTGRTHGDGPALQAVGGEAADFDRRLIAPMILGAVLNPVNSSIIAVSLVPISRAFGAPASQTAWLVSALYLATSIGQPVVGRFVDAYGPRPLFLVGSMLTGAAGLVGALAPNLGVLVCARVILGFGTCAGYPAAMYLIRAESRRTGQRSPAGILTALSVAAQTIVVIGPTAGGLLIALGGWRATFAVNVPLAVAGLVLGARRLPRSDVRDRVGAVNGRVDLPGILLFAVMLVSLLLFLMRPGIADLYLLLVSVLAGAGLTVQELRSRDPFLDLRVLGTNTPLLLTYVRSLLAMTVAYAFLYGFTQWMEDSRGLSAAQTGLVLIPLSLVAILVSSLTGRRPQVRGKLIAGAATQVVGVALLLLLGSHSPIWVLVGVIAIVGIPQGLNSLANQNALYHQADPARMGSSAGLLRTFSYLGAIVASAATGIFFGPTASTDGLRHLATFLLVVSGCFLALCVLDRSLARVGRPGG